MRIPLLIPQLETKAKVRRLRNLMCLCQMMELECHAESVGHWNMFTLVKAETVVRNS
jgi:hypothetical protein